MESKYLDKLEYLKSVDKQQHVYNQMLNTMEAEVQYFYDTFKDDYKNLSGWGHHYFCNVDGGKLIFDIDKPHEHSCEICGKVYTGEKYDSIWTYFYRNEAVLTIWKCAALYKVRGNTKYIKILEKILGYYAENYTNFDLHVKFQINVDINLDVGGAGRLMPQGLNEAIIIIRILNALEIVKEDLSEGFINMLKTKFFDEAVALLRPQVNKIHNIPCWKNSALGAIGFFFDDKELIDFAFNSEFGIINQLNAGVTPDGFWYEGSIHYNFFVLEGVTNLLLFTKLYGYDFPVGEEVAHRMLTAAYNYAFDNHILPNPNDGWPNISLKTYSYIYEIAAKYFGDDSDIANMLKNIENGKLPRTYLPLSKPYFYEGISLEHLLFNPDFDNDHYVKTVSKSKNFETSYFSIIRSGDINVFCKYGLKGPSHAHPDIMNIEVMIGDKSFSRDLSNSGYGAVLCNEWHRMTASHNTVAVDCLNQSSVDGGEILKFEDHSIHAKSSDVYKGVDFSRKINITDTTIEDEFEVTSKEEHQFDYFFHCEGQLQSEFSSIPYEFESKLNGYQHIKEAKKVMVEGKGINLSWKLGDRIIESYINTEGKEFIIAKTYDNPVTAFRTTLILRSKGCNDTFKVSWKLV